MDQECAASEYWDRQHQVRPTVRGKAAWIVTEAMQSNSDYEEDRVVQEPERLWDKGIHTVHHRVEADNAVPGPEDQRRWHG